MWFQCTASGFFVCLFFKSLSVFGLGAEEVRFRSIWVHHHHLHQSLNLEGRWGTTDDFATSFLHFSLFSTALWDWPNSRPVHSLMLSSHLFLCPPCLLPPFLRATGFWKCRPFEYYGFLAKVMDAEYGISRNCFRSKNQLLLLLC